LRALGADPETREAPAAKDGLAIKEGVVPFKDVS
jgi:hypothetical protein